MYAESKGWDVGDVEVEADVAYEGYAPTSFDVTLRLPEGLTDEQKERLLGDRRANAPSTRRSRGETPVSISDRVEAL